MGRRSPIDVPYCSQLNELHSTLALTLGGNRTPPGSAEWTERRAAKLDALRAIARSCHGFVTLERAQLEAPATATQQQGARGARAALPYHDLVKFTEDLRNTIVYWDAVELAWLSYWSTQLQWWGDGNSGPPQELPASADGAQAQAGAGTDAGAGAGAGQGQARARGRVRAGAGRGTIAGTRTDALAGAGADERSRQRVSPGARACAGIHANTCPRGNGAKSAEVAQARRRWASGCFGWVPAPAIWA